jgi:hypothetical protein
MAYDPWDWANQTQQTTPLAAPLSNIVTPMPASNEQGDPGQVITLPPTQAEKDMQQMRSMAVNKGTEKGAEYAYDKYKGMQAGPIGTGAPVVEQSVMASAPTVAAPAGTMAGMGTGAAAEAATAAATQAATAAPLSATVGAAAPAAAGAAEAGMLAGMGPVGWGVGALLLAKSMNWI